MIYSIKNEYLTATINTKGAELTALKSAERDFIWTVDLAFWDKTSPILFPIVGSLKNDEYTFENKKYSLPRHGFARNLEFSVVENNKDKIIFSLQSNEETKQNYPFDFELQIGYFLDEKRLKITYKVINKTNGEMPFSIGGHPAFSISNELKNYSLLFEKQEVLNNYSLKNNLITDEFEEIVLDEKKLPLSYSLFEKDALIFKNLQSKKVTIFDDDKPYLSVCYNDFPSLGVWTKNNAPFLCIEPWFGYADNINQNGNVNAKEGIILLPKNEIFESEYAIEIY